jgi:hypothetical protein
MKANLDNFVYFDSDSFNLQIKSRQRDIVSRKAVGLDGETGIDLGQRSRKLVQSGQLRAANKNMLNEQIADIDKMFDGQSRTLITPGGKAFEDLRIDSFQTGDVVVSGSAVSCNYEIIYTQLG